MCITIAGRIPAGYFVAAGGFISDPASDYGQDALCPRQQVGDVIIVSRREPPPNWRLRANGLLDVFVYGSGSWRSKPKQILDDRTKLRWRSVPITYRSTKKIKRRRFVAEETAAGSAAAV